ncbi:MAG: NPCBM-associated, domain of alpha-galactosidase [Thermoplasmata archaeon]|jgi:hypothetical protein|nr:NPCBM-associated, domain of alpha-galactosidase [Thermoplasmata archaeon]
MRILAAVLALAAAVAFLPGGSAQTHQCGDIDLVFKNPDLQPADDGFIHAEGQFFAQFQAIGPRAAEIAVFGFSFGAHTIDVDEAVCDAPQWATGAYVPNYRADRDASDGFFIPIKTTLVPDGTYAVAVHAYDAQNVELARFWGKAIVDNCDPQPTPAQEKCDQDPAQLVAHDATAPWPIVLPGDGQALDGHQFTIEFGEPLSNLTVYLNGQDITAQMAAWDGRLWDGDYVPDYGPGGLSEVVAPPCSGAPGQACEHYGPAYEWTGRPLVDADVVRIEAHDLAGNLAVKDLHIGSGLTSGAVTADVALLSDSVDHLEQPAAAGGAAVFHFNITNNGGGTGHPFAGAQAPPGWTARWEPVHVVVAPGKTEPQSLRVEVPAGTPDGRYAVNATLTYASGSEEKVIARPLWVVVGAGTAAATSPADDGATAPLPAPFAAVAAALLLARRRLR